MSPSITAFNFTRQHQKVLPLHRGGAAKQKAPPLAGEWRCRLADGGEWVINVNKFNSPSAFSHSPPCYIKVGEL